MHRMLSLAIVSLTVASLTSGCATLGQSNLDAPISDAAATPPQPSAKYTVELRPHDKEWERVEVEFKGVEYISQALVQSGATKRFRRMNIEVLRTSGGRTQKMRSEYDHARQAVPMEWDYAIYPGDRIVITENPATIFDDMIESAVGPLAFFNSK